MVFGLIGPLTHEWCDLPSLALLDGGRRVVVYPRQRVGNRGRSGQLRCVPQTGVAGLFSGGGLGAGSRCLPRARG